MKIEKYFCIGSGKKQIPAPWVSDDKEELDKIEKDLTLASKMKKNIIMIMRENSRQSLDSLGCELHYLKSNGILNAYDLAPIGIKKYFKVMFENEKQIGYFIQNFYKLGFERYPTLERYPTIGNSGLSLIQKKVLSQSKNYFKENLNTEILTFFSTINPRYYNFLHFPINYNISDIKYRLSILSGYISGKIYDELSSEEFSLDKLNECYQLYKKKLP